MTSFCVKKIIFLVLTMFLDKFLDLWFSKKKLTLGIESEEYVIKRNTHTGSSKNKFPASKISTMRSICQN